MFRVNQTAFFSLRDSIKVWGLHGDNISRLGDRKLMFVVSINYSLLARDIEIDVQCQYGGHFFIAHEI